MKRFNLILYLIILSLVFATILNASEFDSNSMRFHFKKNEITYVEKDKFFIAPASFLSVPSFLQTVFLFLLQAFYLPALASSLLVAALS